MNSSIIYFILFRGTPDSPYHLDNKHKALLYTHNSKSSICLFLVEISTAGKIFGSMSTGWTVLIGWFGENVET